uniref:COX assembly mitochondrial protein n=1 Tax=Podarcis muralis TaxID=64176 RepID=A0A670HR69_PODMU
MHPDLSPHLHSEEYPKIVVYCLDIYCHKEHSIMRYFGRCNGFDREMRCWNQAHRLRMRKRQNPEVTHSITSRLLRSATRTRST